MWCKRLMPIAVLIIISLFVGSVTIYAAGSDPSTWSIVYQDNFQDPQSGWEVGETARADKAYVDGAYELATKEAHEWATSFLPGMDFLDFSLDVDVLVQTESSGCFGIIYRNSDWRNYHLLAIKSDGKYMLRAMKDGEQNTLLDWKNMSVTFKKSKSNHLKLIAQGSTFSFFCNGKLVAKYVELPVKHVTMNLQPGRVALVVAAFSEAGLAVRYDNLVIRADPTVQQLLNQAHQLYTQAQGHYNHGEITKALALFQESLVVYKELNWKSKQADSLNNLGNCYWSLSDYQKAIEYYEQALVIYREIGDRDGEANSLGDLGLCYDSLSDYQQATDYYGQSLAIDREIGNRAGEASNLYNLGICYYFLSDYQKAIDYFEQSLVKKREIGDRAGEAASLNNLGVCYDSLSDYRKAIEYYEQSLAIFVEIGDRAGEANSLNNLGHCYHYLSDYQKAIEYYEQALVIYREIGDRDGEANSLGNLGNCYIDLSDYQKAIEYYEQSLAIKRDIGDRAGEAASLGNLGNCYIDLSDYQQAIEYYDQALALSVELGTRDAEQLIHWGLGRTYNALEDPETALTHYEAAIEIVESIRGKVSEEKLRQSYFGSMRTLYEEYLKLLLELGRNEGTMLVAERCRGRTFLDLLAEGPVGTIENVAEEGISSGVVEPSAIEADVEEVVSSLPAGTAVLEYFVTDGATYVWVINRGKIQGPIPLEHGRAELMDEVIACRKKLDAGQEGINRDLAELYDWLIRPVADLLPTTDGEGNVPQLIIIPSGSLYYLPFQALIWTSEDRNEHAPLIVRYALSYSPSLATLKYAQGLSETAYPQATFLGVADPDSGDPDIPRLPGAQIEAQTVAKLFPISEVYVDKQATEDVVQSESATAREILLSTHGLFNPHNPLYSYLLVTPTEENNDGKLFAHEVFGLPLHTDMVVLSACETLLPSLEDMADQLNKIARRAGDDESKELTEDQLKELTAGDEVVGLTRAFISAGAASVLSSLWSVPSKATSQLMVLFYEHVQEGMDKAQALRAAELEVMNTIGCTQPWYWAAFNLMGDWR